MRDQRSRFVFRVLAVALVTTGVGAWASPAAATSRGLYDGSAPERVDLAGSGFSEGSLAAPVQVAPPLSRTDEPTRRRPDPVWTPHGLWATPPAVATPVDEVPVSPAVWDPSSASWCATTAGALVRVGEDGSLRVVVDDVQGRDFDVRAQARVAVSCEPGGRVMLHRFDGAELRRSVLLEGTRYFQPRLSPSGDAVLVAESRGGGGHVWLVRLDDGVPHDLGPGYGAAWHPDGERVWFARIENDGLRVIAADLWQWDLRSGSETRLTWTPGLAETEPALSPDGRFVAWVDGRTGAVLAGPVPAAREGGVR